MKMTPRIMEKKMPFYHADIPAITAILNGRDIDKQKELFQHAQECECCRVALQRRSEEIRRELETRHQYALEA